jgi:hypothetical protein
MGYEGSYKWWTADCGGCPCLHKDYCYWGKDIKHLSTAYLDGTEHKVRRCEFRDCQPATDSAWRIRFRKSAADLRSGEVLRKGPEKPIQGKLPLEVG